MKFVKYYGFNLRGMTVPLPIIGGIPEFYTSKGLFVAGLSENGKFYLVWRNKYKDYEQDFFERVIKDGCYTEFNIDPFSKTPEEWEEMTNPKQ